MKINIKRHLDRPEPWYDHSSGTYSEIFRVFSQGQPIDANTELMPFYEQFCKAHNIDIDLIWTQVNRRNEIVHIRVPIGYAQAFQDEFNREF